MTTSITCIADLHGLYHDLVIEPTDILICAGDITGHSFKEDVRAFNLWFNKQPATYKILIAGNHDSYLERHPSPKAIFSYPFYLQDECITIDGLKIYGTPYQPIFGFWSFNLPEEELVKKWDMIPEDIDILITHCPPYGICDFTTDGEHAGSESLYNKIKDKNLIHIFGHIHEGYGVEFEEHNLYINCSICNESYQPVNKPVRFCL